MRGQCSTIGSHFDDVFMDDAARKHIMEEYLIEKKYYALMQD